MTDARHLKLITRRIGTGRPYRIDTHNLNVKRRERSIQVAYDLAVEEGIQREYQAKKYGYPHVGQRVWTITPPHRRDKLAGLPRVVVQIDKNTGAVWVRATNGTTTWPVYKFWVYYTDIPPRGK